MNTRRPFTLLAALIFALMAVAHIYRIATDFQIIVGSHPVPIVASWIGIFVSAALALMLYRESQR